MNVSELMTREVTTCRPDASLREPTRIMQQEDCGIVPVVDEQNDLRGVITDRDVALAAQESGKGLGEMAVKDAASHEVTSISTDDGIDRLHAAMRERKVRRIPVVDGDGKLEGIVSLGDLARASWDADSDEAVQQPREVARTLAVISKPMPAPRA